MPQQTLLFLEATGIQRYVFGSNQLVQNIGASELVQQATADWLFEHLPEPHNVTRDDKAPEGWTISNTGLQAHNLSAEVVYAGGGNAMVLFANREQAETCTRELTRKVLQQAPELSMVVKSVLYDPDDPSSKPLAAAHQDLRDQLAARKLARPHSVPLLGLGVTAACKFTGAPAVALDDERRPISAEVKAKLRAQGDGERRLRQYLSGIQLADVAFLDDFDRMGTKGEASYIAVIHTDGNNMGERIKRIAEKHMSNPDGAGYIRELRTFSRSVGMAAREALSRTIGMLLDPNNLEIQRDETGRSRYRLGGIVPVPEEQGKLVLPFRPIVFGGDDVTFVCEGRLGLEIATKYLYEFTAKTLADGEPAYARAGIAVVKSHYPFSRAYDLAEALCASSKERIRKIKESGAAGATALDWHFAAGGLVLGLNDVRRREYTSQAGNSLLMRPIHLGHLDYEWRSWQTFRGLVETFQDPQGEWYGRRNKVKALRDALRAGSDSVSLFLQAADAALPAIVGREEMKLQGWQGNQCGYFDAIEATDFFVPLNGGIA